MSIAVTCPQCNKSFQVGEEHAGKKGRCPGCRGIIEVPTASAPPGRAGAQPDPTRQPAGSPATAKASPAPGAGAPIAAPLGTDKPPATPRAQKDFDPARLEQEVLGAFQGDIAPVKVSITYRLGILLVAVLMVILPLVYVGLIGLVCYVIYFHAVEDTGLLEMGRGRGRFVALLVYAGPLAAGGILVLFMIKPLFARSAKQGRIRSLTRDSDPLLFAFVDQVCAAVRAPKPRRIDVDFQVNASAGFRRGFLSMLGRDLVLTIGLPLAAGLSLRQFAGVLAHEFGHFSQGAGMRLTYVVRTVSFWFTRVVYERDRWDQQLVHWSENMDWRLAIILYLARFFVWMTRRILWVLMMIGHMVGGFMLRQMEFDADRYEARLAGSDAFESTARRLVELNVATQGAQADLGTFYQEGRLADNLPRLILANVEQIPAEIRAKVNRMVDESTTGLLDTHPADKDRIASARREDAPGIFHLDRPASVLFRDFDALSKNVTWDFYRAIFGPRFKPSDMHPIDDLLARQSKEQEAGKALGRYFQGAFNTLRPLPLPATPPAAPAKPRQCAAELKEARQRMLQLKPAYDKAFAIYDQADTHALEAEQASALLTAGLRARPTDFSVRIPTGIAAARTRNDALAQQKRTAGELAELEKAAGERLLRALEILHVPQVAAKIENAEVRQRQCARILATLATLTHHARAVLELRNEHASLGILLTRLEGNEQNRGLIQGIQGKMSSMWERLKDLRTQLSSVPYPLDHAKGDISVGGYMLEDLPAMDDLGGIFEAGQSVVETLMVLYARLVGRLVVIAEEVEKLLGLEPLPEPPEKPASPEAAGGPSEE